MKDALSFDIRGLKCDNPSCDFVDMSIKFEDYKEWIDKPCPICGESLLTKQDYYATMNLYNIATILKDNSPQIDDATPMYNMSAKMNGTGKIDFEINPVNE